MDFRGCEIGAQKETLHPKYFINNYNCFKYSITGLVVFVVLL